MGELSERDVEDILGGVQPPGRGDLAPVVELASWMHVSREIEPPPAMRDELFWQIEDGPTIAQRSSRRRPAHLDPRRHQRRLGRLAATTWASVGRPVVSAMAAAVLLVGVILAVRSGGPTSEPAAVSSRPALGAPAPRTAPSTTTTVPATTTSAPDTSTAADPSATTAAPTGEQQGAGASEPTAASTTVREGAGGVGTDPGQTGDASGRTASDPALEDPSVSPQPRATEPARPPLSWWPSFESLWSSSASLWDLWADPGAGASDDVDDAVGVDDTDELGDAEDVDGQRAADGTSEGDGDLQPAGEDAQAD